MNFISIVGNCKLKGLIEISGAKNSALPILASALLTDKVLCLKNIPKLLDVESMISLIGSLGSKVKNKHNTYK